MVAEDVSFSFVVRRCVKECTIGNGVKIVPGVQVHVPIWDIHRNPDIWPDPLAFKPERYIGLVQRFYKDKTCIWFSYKYLILLL